MMEISYLSSTKVTYQNGKASYQLTATFVSDDAGNAAYGGNDTKDSHQQGC